MERYQRHIALAGFGNKGQETIKNTSVLIIGAGGLGVPVMQQLTACGIGTIGIMDGDTIEISNLPRQVLYTEQDVGKAKVAVAAQRLLLMNSEVNIIKYPFFLNAEKALELFKSYDIIVDATDRFDARYLINDACVLFHKPWVYGAVFQWEGQWAVWNFSVNDAEKTTYRDLFPIPPKANLIPDCNAQGVFATVPQIVGYFMANELIKMVLYPKELKSNSLMYFHFLKNSFQSLGIVPRSETIKTPLTAKDILDFDYSYYCGYKTEKDKEGILTILDKDTLIVDVRNKEEVPRLPLKCLEIPLHQLPDRIQELTANKILFVCQTGKRSKVAYEIYKTLLPQSIVDYYPYNIELFIKNHHHA
ncbi:ThiF family adenylyltransferase [Flavobacterium sp.]|uniref:ThiF family adenylyltransferase n=2 Tax=Flavobacterium TaxID=237 RepID=UPI0039E502DC